MKFSISPFRRGIIMTILASIAIFSMAAQQDDCAGATNDADAIQRQRQEEINKEAAAQMGMPTITNFRMAKTLKYILEQCDKEVTTYVYSHSEYSNKFRYIGEAVGYGIPFATQLTNPMKPVYGKYQGTFDVIPQADPDQIFRPSGADGTWIMLKDPNSGKVAPVLFEPKMVTTPFKLPANVVEN